MKKIRPIFLLTFTLLIFFFSCRSQKGSRATLKNGYYKPSKHIGRILVFYQVKRDKIIYYRMHWGSLARLGNYTINTNDSTLIINYTKNLALPYYYKEDESLEADTLELIIESPQEINLKDWPYVEPGDDEFYKSIVKLIRKKSRKVN